MPDRTMTRAEWREWWSHYRRWRKDGYPDFTGFPCACQHGSSRSIAVRTLNLVGHWRRAGLQRAARLYLDWAAEGRCSMGV